ncbi:hypothetical protein [Streptomyces sp. NPDC003710]
MPIPREQRRLRPLRPGPGSGLADRQAGGAVEGAARHLVADRLDITGSRWTVPGAEAVLTLRTVISNGDFPDYWIFHARKEHERLHPLPDQHIYALQA